MTDHSLLQQYISGDRDAMEQIVRRHVDWVYAAAARQAGTEHSLADDVTQEVFWLLCRKARSINPSVSIEGWLFNATRLIAKNHLRKERRLQSRQRQASRNEPMNDTQDTQPLWEQMQPVIDEAMAKLRDDDRQIVLLRYFRQMEFAEIASAIAITEVAARKRLARAMERLRAQLALSKVIATESMIGGAMAAHAVYAAPSAVVGGIVGGIGAGSKAATTSLGVFMATNAKAIFLVSIITAAALGGGSLVVMSHRSASAPSGTSSQTLTVAPTTQEDWHDTFARTYRLDDKDVVRFIAAEDAPDRMQWYWETQPQQAQAIPSGPQGIFFRWKDNRLEHFGMTFGGRGANITTILDMLLQIKPYELEGDARLLALEIAGDWIVRSSANRDDALMAVAKVFADSGMPIRFAAKKAIRDVIVASGTVHFPAAGDATSRPTVYLYSGELIKTPNAAARGGNSSEMLESVAEQLNQRVIDECKPGEVAQLNWIPQQSGYVFANDPRTVEKTDEILRHIHEQTGLTFKHEQREVGFWEVQVAQ